MKQRLFTAAICVLALSACNKVVFNTDYIIEPRVQRVDKGKEVRRDSVVAYGLNGDTTTWKILSFEDALAGVFTNATTGVSHNADRVATYNAIDTLLTLRINCERSVVLVCNYADSVYGWRNVQIGYNMPSMSVLIKFRPWRHDIWYDDGRWRMVRAK